MRLFFLGPRFFGIRPGISLGPGDFRSRRPGQPPPIEGGFIYLITGLPGMVKVGVTIDPRARLAALQTGSAYPLRYVALLATPGTGYVVEARIHEILQAHRATGEWFQVSPSRALFAIRQALDELEEPALSVSLAQADDILAIARSAPAGSKTPSWVYSWWIPIGGGVLTFALVFNWLRQLAH